MFPSILNSERYAESEEKIEKMGHYRVFPISQKLLYILQSFISYYYLLVEESFIF